MKIDNIVYGHDTTKLFSETDNNNNKKIYMIFYIRISFSLLTHHYFMKFNKLSLWSQFYHFNSYSLWMRNMKIHDHRGLFQTPFPMQLALSQIIIVTSDSNDSLGHCKGLLSIGAPASPLPLTTVFCASPVSRNDSSHSHSACGQSTRSKCLHGH